MTNRPAALGYAIAACVSMAMVALSQSPAFAETSKKFDFTLLYHAAQLANQAYDGKSEIIGKHPGRSAWVATPGNARVQYILIRNDERRIQAIAVRGTANDTNWDLDMDTRGVKDKKTGILMHRGFRTAAEAIYGDVKPRLRPGYTTYLTGHSLGGAVAAILGTYLLDDEVKIGGILTFGQPKFTNRAGAEAYKDLPLLRLIYQNDTVALLPDRTKGRGQEFVHTGEVINLLSGPYYVYGTAEQSLEFSGGSFGKLFGQISLPDHSMKWYLKSLRDKLDGAKEVSFKDRNQYIIRHRRGTGGAQRSKPVKRTYNFNRHHPD